MRVAGIRIGVSPFWFLFLLLLILSRDSYYKDLYPGQDSKAFFLAVIAGLLFPASILAHELGHALAAKREGVEVGGIELWLLGGLARMAPARTAGAEFRVAAAGPAVTLLLLLICLGLGATVLDWDNFRAAAAYELRPNMGEAEAVLGYITWINAIMFVFNLLPGLPLDGGRIVRALAWWKTGDRLRATTVTAGIGRVLAYLLGAFGIYELLQGSGGQLAGIWSLVLAWLIGQAARAEQARGEVTSRIEHLHVSDVMDAEPVAVPAGLPASQAIDDYFHRYGWDWFPVVDADGHFIGLAEREKLEQAGPSASVGDVVAPDSRREFGVDVDEPLDTLLGSEPLQRLGAIMAVDGDGVLRGVVTVEQVLRALQPVARTA
jgi:Zn-dependent protease